MLSLGASIVAMIAAGCGGSHDSSAQPTIVDQNPSLYLRSTGDNTVPEVISTQGQLLTQEELSTRINQLLPKSGPGCIIDLLEPNPSLPGRVGIPVGCWRIMVRWENGYVGSCIRRKTWRHLNFHVRNSCGNYDLANFHLVGWLENGPQVGIYNSTNGWCAQSRGTWSGIRDTVYKALLAAGLSGGVAWVISNIIAGMAIPAFAF